jgi:hypothetical protein
VDEDDVPTTLLTSECGDRPDAELADLCSSVQDLTVLGLQLDLALILWDPEAADTEQDAPNAIASHLFLSTTGLGMIALRPMRLALPERPELPRWLVSGQVVGSQLRRGLRENPASTLIQPEQARDSRLAAQFSAVRPSEEVLEEAARLVRENGTPIGYDLDDIFVYVRTPSGRLYTIRVFYGTTADGHLGLRRRVRARAVP